MDNYMKNRVLLNPPILQNKNQIIINIYNYFFMKKCVNLVKTIIRAVSRSQNLYFILVKFLSKCFFGQKIANEKRIQNPAYVTPLPTTLRTLRTTSTSLTHKLQK